MRCCCRSRGVDHALGSSCAWVFNQRFDTIFDVPYLQLNRAIFASDVILAYEILPSILKEHHNFQEVKDCAITCLGLVISTFGDHLRVELPSCLPVLVDCMGNERTRLTAVKAFAVIAASPLHLEISCVLEQVVSELSALLKKPTNL
ncbi:Cullin-associated NEDD8-dissociated protein 1 [Orobanche hederae]